MPMRARKRLYSALRGPRRGTREPPNRRFQPKCPVSPYPGHSLPDHLGDLMALLRLNASRPVMAAAVATLAGAALVLSASGAAATTLHFKDQAHDVVEVRRRSDSTSAHPIPDASTATSSTPRCGTPRTGWGSRRRSPTQALRRLPRGHHADRDERGPDQGRDRVLGHRLTSHRWRGDAELEKPNGDTVRATVAQRRLRGNFVTIGIAPLSREVGAVVSGSRHR